VAAVTADLAKNARQYGDNLQTAAKWYQQRDQTAAVAIEKIEFPKK
jgi:hypothetical protein